MRVLGVCLMAVLISLNLIGCDSMTRGGSSSSSATTTTPVASGYSISGYVAGLGYSGVLLTLTYSATGIVYTTTTSNTNGYFNFTGIPVGSYTITPSKKGYTFSPVTSSASVSIAGGNVSLSTFTSSYVSVVSSSQGTADRMMFLMSDGTVLAAGRNFTGQIGDGTSTDRTAPTQVLASAGTSLQYVQEIAGGDRHSLALKGDGTVWAWGSNINGPLGDGSETPSYYPVQVTQTASTVNSNISDVVAVSAGANHSVAIKSDGSVWTWGDNSQGQNGMGDSSTKANRLRAEQIATATLTGVVAVASGDYHILALKYNGYVSSWGRNYYGQLGTGTSSSTATDAPTAVLASAGTSLTKVVAVAAGSQHSLALLSDGTVKAWGDNTYGQLGDGSTTQRNYPVLVTGLSQVVAIAAGQFHSLALTSDGKVYSWGSNAYGQLGNGGLTTYSSTAALISGITGATSIGAGSNHSFAIRNDNTVLVWGHNNYGQFGIGTGVSQSSVPISAGF